MAKKNKPEITIQAVVCADTNYGIGYKNSLLISIPEDLKHFSRITSGGPVIVGRKTYESLPKKPLQKRLNIVITSSGTDAIDEYADVKQPLFVTMETAKAYLMEKIAKREKCTESEKVSIIGGAQIYNELLPYCDMIQITKVFKSFDDVDAYFPNLDKMYDWEIVGAGDIEESDGVKFQKRKYKNTKPMKIEKEKAEKKTKKKKTDTK